MYYIVLVIKLFVLYRYLVAALVNLSVVSDYTARSAPLVYYVALYVVYYILYPTAHTLPGYSPILVTLQRRYGSGSRKNH